MSVRWSLRIVPLIFCLLPVKALAGASPLLPTDSADTKEIDLPGLMPTETPLPEPAEDPSLKKKAADLWSGFGNEKMSCKKQVLSEITMSETKTIPEAPLWLANSGVKAYHQLKLAESPCRAVLTELFYKNLKKTRPPKRAADRLSTGRPALNAAIGKGTFADDESGSVLDAAMELAGGRRALAMSLIGFCGHDDQQNETPLIIGFQGKSSLAVLRYLDAEKNKNGEPLSEGDQKKFDVLRSTIEKSGRATLDIRCPKPWESFYAPKSLGESVDIPETLKQEIADIQAPTKGMGALPAKYYHTMFGSMVGCRLSSVCGLSPAEAQKELELLAQSYRNLRLKGQSLKYESLKKLIESEFKIDWKDETSLKAKEEEIRAWMKGKSTERKIQDLGLSEIFSEGRAKMSWEAVKVSIDTALYDLGQAGDKSVSRCTGLSPERCRKVLEKSKTHEIDLTWTKSQQGAGSSFGAEFCAKEKNLTEAQLEQQACDALDKRNKSGGGGPSKEGDNSLNRESL